MGKVIIGLVLGLVIGAVGALVFGGGAMMGVGAGTGLVTGICSVVEAAQQSGLLTPDQINQVLAKAAENMSGHPLAAGTEIADSGAQCEQVMKNVRAHR
jgi:hypothetical protein